MLHACLEFFDIFVTDSKCDSNIIQRSNDKEIEAVSPLFLSIIANKGLNLHEL
jgi:hypothetical protein